MKRISAILLMSIILFAFKADKPAYQFFNTKGKKVKYSKVIKELKKADVIFIGELHNNPINHWMEYEITKDIYTENEGNITIGAEMFESDNQLLLDEYLSGKISLKSFEKEARLWPNYKTDYKPLLEFAKDSNLNFIATNIPRRYASVVHKKDFTGLEELSDQAKSYIAPLPIEYDPEVGCYKSMMEMMSGMGHANANLPKAQAIKDATMAHFIVDNLEEGSIFIHYNGSFHSDNHQGIIWYLEKYKPGLKIMTISSIESDSLKKINDEDAKSGDFILVTPETMTKTY